ncbi:aquaporin-4-like [Erpetoichthys calabaricus]|uniref:Aquaporin-4 n=1 Tax=Erpetoichthys calabaricus TaxID=27687 RepID=A0A8C4RR82_ERPCA|nr:aquaporin-4-like [Erpetoichthys calabaricus]
MTAFKGVWTRQFWTSMAGEFLAVFIFLVVSLGCTVNLKDQATPGPSTTHIALCFGFSIAILIHCFGHICEVYLNPAVAVAMICTKKISMAKGVFYIIAQCMSALAAAGTVALVTPHSKWPVAVTQVNENLSAGQALLVEVFITFQLVFTIFASCDSKRKDIKVPIPLIIGLSVTIGHLFAIPYTGASMNPARSLGVAVVFNSWHNHWIYWIGPLMGALLAAFIYEYVFCPDPERKLKLKAIYQKSSTGVADDSVQLTPGSNTEYSKLEAAA